MYTRACEEVTCGGTRFGPALMGMAEMGFWSSTSPCPPCLAEGAAWPEIPVYLCVTAIHRNCKQIFALSCSRVVAVQGFILAFLPKKMYAEIPPKHIYMCFSWKQKKTIIRKCPALLLISGALSKFH